MGDTGMKTGKVLVHEFIQHTLMEHLSSMPATIGNKTDPALPPKESEQIICNCNNLMKKKNRVLGWRIMVGGLGED